MFSSWLCKSQINEVTTVWVNKIASESGIVKVLDSSVDDNGNLYITGSFSGSVDVDASDTSNSIITANGLDDIFVLKLNSEGELIWVKQFGGNNDDVAKGITIHNNYVYITGYFNATVNFDSNNSSFQLTSNGNNDIFILKLNASGSVVWVKQQGGVLNDECLAITTDDNGNVYTTGYFWSTADFDPSNNEFNLTSSGQQDVFISKLNSEGELVWVKQIESFFGLYGNDIKIDSQGNVFTAGFFYGNTDFNPSSETNYVDANGFSDGFILKLNESGEFVWVKTLQGYDDGEDYGGEVLLNKINIDSNDDIILTGSFNNSIDLDPSDGLNIKTSNGNYDAFLVKLNADGSTNFGKQIGGIGNDFLRDHQIGNNNTILFTGRFEQTVEFDSGNSYALTSYGSSDIFLSKLNTSGEFVYAKHFGGTSFDSGSFLSIDAEENLFLLGSFNGTANFGADSHSYEVSTTVTNSVFLQKLSNCNIDAEITITDNVLSANATNTNYQWINCTTNEDITNATAQSFEPIENGSYAVKISYNNCEVISDCIEIETLSNEFNYLKAGVKVYPNPSEKLFNVSLPENYKLSSYELYNSFGQLVSFENKIESSDFQFEINTNSGVYFLKVYANDSNTIFKIIKN